MQNVKVAQPNIFFVYQKNAITKVIAVLALADGKGLRLSSALATL